MPVICVNPTNEIEAEIINKLSLQNQDLRLFVSNKNEENYINKLQGKKAVGDVTDDTHISTASRGAFCGVFFENNERDIYYFNLKFNQCLSLMFYFFLSTHSHSK